MGLVNQTIPGLYGGVSQQAPELRHDTQVDEMINCYPTIIGGVTKRPPTRLAYNDNSFPAGAFIYAYDRGAGNEKYIIAIKNESAAGTINQYIPDYVPDTETLAAIKGQLTTGETWVYNTSNGEWTTNTAGNNLSTAFIEFTCTIAGELHWSVGSEAPYDNLYIFKNGTKVVDADGVQAGSFTYAISDVISVVYTKDSDDDVLPDTATFTVTDGTIGGQIGYYRIFDLISNKWINSWTADAYLNLPSGYQPKDYFTLSTVGDTTFVVNRTIQCAMNPTVDWNDDSDWDRTFYYWVKRTNGDATDNANLRYTYYLYKNGAQQTSQINHDSTAAATALASAVGGTAAGSVLKKVAASTSEIWSGADSWGNQASESFQGSIKRLVDLPNELGFVNAVIEITGDENSNFDNFYVKYDGSSYLETFKPGLANSFDASTMPHQFQIRRTSLNPEAYYINFSPIDWLPRKVGDEDSAAEPSFIGRPIEDVFFYRNRLGFLSGDNVILSESGEYYNFWPTTVTDTIDSDAIDVAVDSNQAVSLRYATPFNKELLLFANKAQFVMSSADTLTPTNVSVQQSTAFEIKDVTPVVLGPNAYFAIEKNDFSTIREYYVQPDSLSNDAANITAHCPNYIPKNLTKLVGSSKNDMLFALSSDTKNTIYVYNFYWQGEEKAQSAWHKWTFDGNKVNIFNIEVLGSTLLIMLEREGFINLETIELEHRQDFLGTSYLDNGSEVYESKIVLTKPGFSTGKDKVDDHRGTLVLRNIKFSADYGSFYAVTSYRYGKPLGYYHDSHQGVFPPRDYITFKEHKYDSTPGVQPNYSTLPSSNLYPGVTTYEMYSDHKYPVVGNANNLAIAITNDIAAGFRINSLDIVGTYQKNSRNV